MRIKAFQGLRPTPDTVEKVAAVPYDVVNTEEARALAKGNPLSLLHVSRPEIDLPDGTNPYSDEVYARGVENLKKLQDEEGLIRETAPCLYVYQQKMGDHIQKGLVTVSHVEDYLNDLIKKHEKTRQQKEDDRTRITSELNANVGPVFLTYRHQDEIDKLVEETCQQEPFFDFTAPDGIVHTAWRVEGGQAYVDAFAKVPVSYVADGHHRSASAARVGKERREANPNHTGDENYNWFLSVLFPDNQLKILSYNRAVFTLNGHSAGELIEKIKTSFSVTETTEKEPSAPGNICMFLEGKWYHLSWQSDPNADPVSVLDVSVLQDRLLSPLLGIEDPRTSENIEFIGGIRGTSELENKVNEGKAAVAFSMYPVTVDQLIAIADAGQIMPPKSTWFEPKLRSGLFIHTLE